MAVLNAAAAPAERMSAVMALVGTSLVVYGGWIYSQGEVRVAAGRRQEEFLLHQSICAIDRESCGYSYHPQCVIDPTTAPLLPIRWATCTAPLT